MSFRLILLLWLLNYSSAQDANCDYYQSVAVGSTYYISNPNYPNSYRPGVQCRWIANCPTGYNCRVSCPDIRLPQTQSCSMDRLLVSRTGDPQLNAAETYCGPGSLTAVSTDRTISLGLITSTASTGGRFQCSLTAQAVQQPPSQCVCGVRRQNRIVGGQETGINEFTMMAGLVDRRITQIKCGGVIISQRFVLSAAHCVANQSEDNFAVLVGEHNVNNGDTGDFAKAYIIAQFIVHPGFASGNLDNDIVLVRVAVPMQFNDRVLPVCLPFLQANNDFAGSKVTVVGWGTTFFGGPSSNVPLKADLDVLSQSTCRSRGVPVNDRQMCTFTPGKDSCQDDSGGPVLWTNPNNGALYVVGLISSGTSCASNSPSLNTRVTSFLSWIQQNTQETYCMK